MIPALLLNATAEFFTETNPQGTFGQPRKVLVSIGSARVRADQKSESRTVSAGSFEQRMRVFTLDTNELPPLITNKTWVQVTSDLGYEFLAQVDSVVYPGLMGNHSELRVVEQPPSVTDSGLEFAR
jgi:hypothetical protein